MNVLIRVSAVCTMSLLAVSACGSSDDEAADDPSEPSGTEAPAADSGADEALEPAVDEQPQPPADGRYRVGDAVVARDFGVTYLGLAAVPISGTIWSDGICYAPLYEVTNQNSIDDRYSTGIVRGWFSDGSSTDNGNTEDGCTLSLIEDAGYQSEFELVAPGATVKLFSTAFYVPEAAIGTLDLVTVDNNPPEAGGLAPDITLDLVS